MHKGLPNTKEIIHKIKNNMKKVDLSFQEEKINKFEGGKYNNISLSEEKNREMFNTPLIENV